MSATSTASPSGLPASSGPFAWFTTLGAQGRAPSSGAFGLLAMTTLVVSAIGGAAPGVLTDRIGRVATLLLTVITYAVFTVACGFASSYGMLLVFRALQGLGFGGEWAAGAVLVAECCRARHRGRVPAWVQSAWAVGWALAVLVYTVVFQFVGPELGWRVLLWTGALPALLVLYARWAVKDAPGGGGAAAGVQGGYYALFTWLPTYLKTARGLSVIGTGGYLFLITGACAGYVTGGHVTDRLGRKRTFILFAVASALLVVGYTAIPAGANTAILFLGFPLGLCASAIFSGFGAYRAELYPAAVRGTGQGFTDNFGRGVGALFPAGIGFAAQSMGVGGAMVFAAAAYAVAVLALFGLPETVGRELT